MTNFSWWQAQANGNDRVLCMICFTEYPIDEMYHDEAGDAWDVCVSCQEEEDGLQEVAVP